MINKADVAYLQQFAKDLRVAPPDGIPQSDDQIRLAKLEAEIDRLGRLPKLEYELCREQEAKRLKLRVRGLDEAVADIRRTLAGDTDAGSGAAIKLYEPEPWPDPVDGGALLTDIKTNLLRFMVMRETDAVACALWSVHSHAYDLFSHTPRLLVTAPEAECAKTLLMTHLVGDLANRPYSTELMKVAPFFRLIESRHPTFLIDEVDVFIKEDSDLLAGINNGWEPHGQVLRCVGDDFEVRAFSTHTPVAMAGIKLLEKLPATTISRSIVINLERATDEELSGKVLYDARRHRSRFLELGQQIARWVSDNRDRIRNHTPTIPAGVSGRPRDKWYALLIIAELAGGEWPAAARHAIVDRENAKEPTRSIQLLMDVHSVLRPDDEKGIWTTDLLNRLEGIEDSPWRDYNYRARDPEERRITSRQVASLLKPYKVHPETVWIGHDSKKGYHREAIEKALARYAPKEPPEISVNPSDASNPAGFQPMRSVSENKGLTDTQSPEANKNALPDGLTDKWGGTTGADDIAESANAVESPACNADDWEDTL